MNNIDSLKLHDPLPGHQKVAIFGLGASGLAAARLLASFGKTIIASDTAPETKRSELEARLPAGSRLILGKNDFADATAIVTSPGLAPDFPIFLEAAKKNIPVLAELELGARSTTTPIVAITGTDGKTTTTTLTNHILNTCGKVAQTGGNIGIPLSQVVAEAQNLDYLVVETSAFQLPFCHTFHPKILIATNIAEDHSEYFKGDWQKYVEAKRKPLSNMSADDVAVLNASDPEIAPWRDKTQAAIFWYGESEDDIPDDATCFAFLTEDEFVFCYKGEHFRYSRNAVHLKGLHNAMNILSSVCACRAAGCPFESSFSAIGSYKLPPHRIETVCVRRGVTFIDDSKATNPHAAIAALVALHRPLVLIAGGVDKGLHLGLWLETMKGCVTGLVLIGALTERLHREALEAGLSCPIVECDTLPNAVAKACELAGETHADTVLLSPACSSYDMFDNYGQRGDVFALAARELE